MQRDWDLIRRILLAVEAEEQATGLGWIEFDEGELGDFSKEAVSYHVVLLGEAGLLDTIDASTGGGIDVRPRRLTWEGHEFLDKARENSTWEKAKRLAAEKAGSLSFAALQEALSRLISSSF